MTNVAVTDKTIPSNYTGLDGGVPIKVRRTATFIIAGISEPVYDGYFRNYFRSVGFVDLHSGDFIEHPIFDGRRYAELVNEGVLAKGNKVRVTYDTAMKAIEKINGMSWH